MVGGEMLNWTEDRPAAGGQVLAYIASRLPEGAEVLAAGPHDAAVLDALAARGPVTSLLRSQPDAAALDEAGRTVLCGTLTKLPEAAYDVIVAFDGVGRLCSTEGPQLGWQESVRTLKRALRPGGTLLLMVGNELGVNRLVETGLETAGPLDSTWLPLGEYDDKPGNPARLSVALTGEGFTVDLVASAWPSPSAPTMITAASALRGGPVEALAAAVASAVARAYAERSVLSDPRRLAGLSVRAGLGPELAPAWLVVARQGDGPQISLPPVLMGDGPVVSLTPRADGEWVREVVQGPAADEPGEPLPSGRLLEEVLLGACLRHDLPTLRKLLTGWIAAEPGATADNVVVHGDAYVKLDPSVAPEPDVLHRFAQTLLAGGYAQPWPAAVDVPTLTAVLHGAAGLPVDVPALPGVDDLPIPDARREHEEQLRALRKQVADAAFRAQWYERELNKRDRELSKARLKIDAFSGTVGYRVLKVSAAVARTARNRIRKGLK